MSKFKPTQLLVLLVGFLWSVTLQTAALGQSGHILDAVGPVNQSMGGAGTAMPLDALGALYENPASITGLPGSEIGFGFQAFASSTDLSSSVTSGSFGPGIPSVSISGSTASDTDISPIPSFGFVHNPEDSRWAYGISGFGVAGFGVDIPGSTSNPITSPQPPNGFGFGPIYSNFQLLQVTTTVAYKMTDHLSFGMGLNGNWATLGVSPFSGAIPDDANSDGFASYPSGTRSDAVWGLGFQAGIYYENPSTGIHIGGTFKSPQWFQTYKINSQNELGIGRSIEFDMDYPMILSLGAGYSGLKQWRFATDVSYVDYENTDGFQSAGFDASGKVTGFGWKSIWSVATGAEYKLLPTLALRAGYTFNQSPVQSKDTFFNVHAPAIIQHHLSAGFSYETPHEWILSMAFHHGFRNSISGSWHGPAGPILGTSVSSALSTYSLTAGLSRKF